MRKSLLFSLLILFFSPTLVCASYLDFSMTPEIEYCTQRTNDWNMCLKEANSRYLNDIKMKYRNMLADKTLLEWNKSIARNKQLLHDMYESWTAYRNRLCALNELASQYSGPLVNPNLSCTLNQMEMHANNMDSVIQLLTKKAPKKQSQFKFLRFEHDEEYENCVSTRSKNNPVNCLKEEIDRTNEQILQKYQEAYESQMIGDWNNGPNLQNGNYRDMYDSWVAYRNRFCSLAVWAYKRTYGEKSVSMNYCLESFNKNMLIDMQRIMIASVSFLDDDVPEELDEYYAEPGEAGKRITPLERRFDRLEGFEDIPLKDKKLPKAEAETKTESDAKSEKPSEPDSNLPSWARAAQ